MRLATMSLRPIPCRAHDSAPPTMNVLGIACDLMQATPTIAGDTGKSTAAADSSGTAAILWLEHHPYYTFAVFIALCVAAGVLIYRMARSPNLSVGLSGLKVKDRSEEKADKRGVPPTAASSGDSAATVSSTGSSHATTHIHVLAGGASGIHTPTETPIAANADSRDADPRDVALSEADPLFWKKADPVFHWLYQSTRYAMKSIIWIVEVDANWGVTVETRREIHAIDVPVVALAIQRGSEDQPMDRFEELQLHASDGQGRGLHWIPTYDRKHIKRFVVFLREVLLPGGKPIEVMVSTHWPRAASKLARVGESDSQDYRLPRGCVGGCEKTELRLTLPTANGKTYRVSCDHLGFEHTVPTPDTHSKTLLLDFGASEALHPLHIVVSRIT